MWPRPETRRLTHKHEAFECERPSASQFLRSTTYFILSTLVVLLQLVASPGVVLPMYVPRAHPPFTINVNKSHCRTVEMYPLVEQGKRAKLCKQSNQSRHRAKPDAAQASQASVCNAASARQHERFEMMLK